MGSNIRSVINRKRDSNPEEYKKFSERLSRLLNEYQQQKIEYKELLKAIRQLAQDLKNQNVSDPRINTPGKKALYDNLGQNADLAIMVDGVIRANAMVGFRTNDMRKRKLQRAIENALSGTGFDASTILNIVVHNNEYGN